MMTNCSAVHINVGYTGRPCMMCGRYENCSCQHVNKEERVKRLQGVTKQKYELHAGDTAVDSVRLVDFLISLPTFNY